MAAPTGMYDYDSKDFLKSLNATNAENLTEYNSADFLKNLTQPQEATKKSTDSSVSNVLKGAEFFARNPVGGTALNQPVFKDIGKGVASVIDNTIGSAIPSAAGYVTQAMVRPFTTPERSAEIGQSVSGALDKPVGKAFGITEDPAYKNEALQRFNNYIGENLDKGADYLAKQTGLPKEDVANIMNTFAIGATAGAAKVGTPVVKNAVNQVQNQFNQAKANLTRAPEQPTTTTGGAPGTSPITPKAVEVLDPNTGQPIVAVQQAPIDPILAQKVTQIEQAGGSVNPEAVARQNKALSVDPRLQLTEGQALQDATLISQERNDRGIKEQ